MSRILRTSFGSLLINPFYQKANVFCNGPGNTHLLRPHGKPALRVACRRHRPLDFVMRSEHASFDARICTVAKIQQNTVNLAYSHVTNPRTGLLRFKALSPSRTLRPLL